MGRLLYWFKDSILLRVKTIRGFGAENVVEDHRGLRTENVVRQDCGRQSPKIMYHYKGGAMEPHERTTVSGQIELICKQKTRDLLCRVVST